MLLPYKVEHDKVVKQSQAWVLYCLILLFILAFIFLHLMNNQTTQEDLIYDYGLSKHDFSLANCFTYTFLHAGVFHLIANCYILSIYGFSLERLNGSLHFFLIFFLGSALSGAIHCLTLAPYSVDLPCIGASGGVSAVLGCFLVQLPSSKVGNVIIIFFKPIFFNMRAWIIISLWLLFQLFSGLKLKGESEFNNVAYWAHIFGFAIGAAYGAALKYNDKRKLKKWANHQGKQMNEALDSIIRNDGNKALESISKISEVHP